ncbi:MAG: hypothetical protein OHK0017_01930 [Patescibacteria group bacterium]
MSAPSLSTLIKINDLLTEIKNLSLKLEHLKSELANQNLLHEQSLKDEKYRLESNAIQKQNLERLEADLNLMRQVETESYATLANHINTNLEEFIKSTSFHELLSTIYRNWTSKNGSEPSIYSSKDCLNYLPVDLQKLAQVSEIKNTLRFENEFKSVDLDPESIKQLLSRDLFIDIFTNSVKINEPENLEV